MEAKWYPDPTGRHELRYWDGRQWTAHVSDGGRQGTDPPTMSVPPPPASGSPVPSYPPSPYGAPTWQQQGPGGWGTASREHPQGTTVLVLGILSVVVCGILGPIAWGMGNKARREMDAEPSVNWANRGMVTAGWICGIVASCILILTVVIIALALAIAAGTSSS